jgi:hypothetical protein
MYPWMWALKTAPVIDFLERIVLVAMADAADQDGCNSFRSTATHQDIAKGMSGRTITRNQRSLEERGLIRRDMTPPPATYLRIPADRRPVRWEICVPYTWWSEPQMQELQKYRADRGLPPLTPEDRPDLGPAPAKPPRADKGQPRKKRADNGVTTSPVDARGDYKSGRGVTTSPVAGCLVVTQPSPNTNLPQDHPLCCPHSEPTLLPDDFAVTPEMTAWGRSVVPDLAGRGETGRFVAYHRTAGTLSDDWGLAWQQWMVGASAALRAAATNPPQEAMEALNPTGADTDTPPTQNPATGDDRSVKQSEQKSPTEPKPARSPRGTRLPETWTPTQALLDWATTEHPKIDLRLETEKFRDHWLSKAGRDATKVDWDRAWRNWIRNARPTWDAARRGSNSEAERMAQALETIHYLREHKPVNPYKAAAAECGLPWGDLGPGTKNDNDDVIGAPKVQPAIDWASMMGSPG